MADEPTLTPPSSLQAAQNAHFDAIAAHLAQQYKQGLPKGYVGRYSKIADETTVSFLFRAFASGLPDVDACSAAGIHVNTYRNWQEAARQDQSSVYWEFLAELKRARDAGRQVALERIQAAGEKPHLWASQAWLLERGDPEHWALRRDTDTTQARIVVQIGVRDSEIILGAQANSPQLVEAIADTGNSHSLHNSHYKTHVEATQGQGAGQEGIAVTLPAAQAGPAEVASEPIPATGFAGGTLPVPLHTRVRGRARSKGIPPVSKSAFSEGIAIDSGNAIQAKKGGGRRCGRR